MKMILCSGLFALGMFVFALPAHADGTPDKPADSAPKKAKKSKKKKAAEGDNAGDAAKK